MSHTLELSRERKQLRFASREEALQDIARRAGEITGTFIDPKAFSHLVRGDRPEWVAEWTRTDLVNTVEIYRCADQDRPGLATAVAILGDGARTAAQALRDAAKAGRAIDSIDSDVLTVLDDIHSVLSMVGRALTREEAREARCREALAQEAGRVEVEEVTA
ncbi:MAG: hypothetical protein Q4D96_13990 [Propionibacteriaceae bacterium]|nr:hypothetical protein [Propionibacteriaceae bacterium]